MSVPSADSNGDAPTVISTFAGCGGSSLGYKLAGFRELLAIEWDQNAMDTFRLNFPNVPVYYGDIVKLTGTECMRLAGIGSRELDVFDGSPPCQGFSLIGKRRFDDPRNSLFREYARLLRELQPKVFVMENVIGMVKGYMKQVYLIIIETLRKCGYRARGEVLNAMYFNVPQSRERVIIIGVRNDLDIEPSHPKPQTYPITARDAIRGVINDAEELRWLFEASSKYATYQSWFDMPIGTSRADLGLPGFFCRKWDPRRPVPTITKSESHIGQHGAMHWAERRRFTVAEFKRFASFPDSFQFTGGYKAVECIGNSVPPNFMRAIAEHIRKKILEQCVSGD